MYYSKPNTNQANGVSQQIQHDETMRKKNHSFVWQQYFRRLYTNMHIRPRVSNDSSTVGGTTVIPALSLAYPKMLLSMSPASRSSCYRMQRSLGINSSPVWALATSASQLTVCDSVLRCRNVTDLAPSLLHTLWHTCSELPSLQTAAREKNVFFVCRDIGIGFLMVLHAFAVPRSARWLLLPPGPLPLRLCLSVNQAKVSNFGIGVSLCVSECSRHTERGGTTRGRGKRLQAR